MADLAVQVSGLRKSYGPIEAVRGITLEVERGEIFGLIGPNGAGKTTTLEILEGHRHADDGEVRVLGFDPADNDRAFKERIGIVLQSTSVPQYLRVEEVIAMYAGYYPHPRPVAEVLELVGLTEDRRRLARRLSGGQQRRLDVGVGLAGDPDLLFLDEPTTGFDPTARRAAWDMVRGLRDLGKTILLTTHYMEEAQALADRVAILLDGRIAAEGTPDELRSRYTDTRISFRGGIDGIPASVGRSESEDGRVVIHTDNATRSLHELTSWAVSQGVSLEDLTVAPYSLEDVFLKLSREAEAAE